MQISAGEFKAKCLQLMDNVQKSHEELIITKFGKPVAKLVPLEKKHRKNLFGLLEKEVVIQADIVKSIDEKWEVDE